MKRTINSLFVAIILAGIVWSCSDDKEDSLFRLQVDNTDVTIYIHKYTCNSDNYEW